MSSPSSKRSQKSDPKSSEAPPQVWIFLYEEMASANFRVETQTTAEVKAMGSSLESILKLLHLEHSEHNSYSFYLISTSMKAPVRLLIDASVLVTYELYCQKDPVVTVIVRPDTDPSPNSSQTPSTLNSLRERRKVSGQHNLQNVFIQPRLPSWSTNLKLDVISQEPMSELN